MDKDNASVALRAVDLSKVSEATNPVELSNLSLSLIFCDLGNSLLGLGFVVLVKAQLPLKLSDDPNPKLLDSPELGTKALVEPNELVAVKTTVAPKPVLALGMLDAERQLLRLIVDVA